MKLNIPKIKRELSAFLVGEEGKISKQSILTIGAFLAITSLFVKETQSGIGSSGLTATSTPTATGVTVTGSHSHHASHSSY